jgi:hypothetical protein
LPVKASLVLAFCISGGFFCAFFSASYTSSQFVFPYRSESDYIVILLHKLSDYSCCMVKKRILLHAASVYSEIYPAASLPVKLIN